LGFAYREIAGMTLPQLHHALQTVHEGLTALSQTKINAITQQRRHKIFDRIVASNCWMPGDLLLLPIRDLRREIQRHIPGAVDAAALPKQVEQYVHSKRGESHDTYTAKQTPPGFNRAAEAQFEQQLPSARNG
jgi:hypothetical protein